MKLEVDRSTIEQLQRQILRLQTPLLQQTDHPPLSLGFGAIKSAFPGNVFPTGATHELISYTREDAAATNGFIAVLLGKLMQQGEYCV